MLSDHPALFNANMVGGILNGRKTQTRRVCKNNDKIYDYAVAKQCADGSWVFWAQDDELVNNTHRIYPTGGYKCPYGVVGDNLWVKETHYLYGYWAKNGISKTGKQKWSFRQSTADVRYFDNPPDDVKPNTYRKNAWYKRPSIFMPRWASRINLEITDIRVERLNTISEEDCFAEGIIINDKGGVERLGKKMYASRPGKHTEWELSASAAFQRLWDSITKKYPWASNWWVWVISFRRRD